MTPNDFEVGKRHNLPMVRVLTYDGRMTGASDRAAWQEERARRPRKRRRARGA